MSSLALAAAAGNPLYNIGYRAGQHYGGLAMRYAGRKIVRAGRNYISRKRKARVSNGRSKAKRRRQIGEAVGHSTAKSNTVQNTTTAVAADTRTLYQVELTQLTRNTTDVAIDNRVRDIANIRGFKCCFQIRANNGNSPLEVNWAVVSPKSSQAVSVTDFFRGTDNTRSLDFGTARTSLENTCLPINTDLYTILTRKRFTLSPKDAAAADYNDNRRNFKMIEKWIPLKRQIRYDGASSTSATTPVYAVWWCDKSFAGTTDAATVGAATVMDKYVVYFKPPK